MPQSPIDILANAQRLKSSPSSANMDNYADIFAGPEEGHVPTAWEQQSGDANADRAETALGAGPAIDALRHLADNKRLDTRANIQAEDDDFLQHGYDRAMGHANVDNQVADVNSEAAAERQFQPWQEGLHARGQRELHETNDTRYLQPAIARAQGDIGAAQIGAQGRIGAVQARNGQEPLRALMVALNELVAQGKTPTDEDVINLKRSFGVQ